MDFDLFIYMMFLKKVALLNLVVYSTVRTRISGKFTLLMVRDNVDCVVFLKLVNKS